VTSPAANVAELPTLARLKQSAWVFGPLAGIALGLSILGIGGRIAMRVIAHATNGTPAFSLGGTATVVLLGGVSGAAGGLIYAVLARLMPNWSIVRMLTFGVILVLLTLRGLSPPTPLSLALFVPLILVYGALLDQLCRRRLRQNIT
jgi:hypothetical protein